MGTGSSFADIAATIQDIFEVEQKTAGKSFKDKVSDAILADTSGNTLEESIALIIKIIKDNI